MKYLRGDDQKDRGRCRSIYSDSAAHRNDNTRKMGIEEMENFPLRIFIFFLKRKYIFP